MAPLKPTSKSTKRKLNDESSQTKPKKSKSTPAQKEPSPDPQSSHSDEEEEEEIPIHGLTSDEEDSSDDEIGGPIEGIDITKLPTVAKDDETVKRRLEKAKRQPTEDRGVIYIGRLPHGFYEDQLKGYFSQFGDITRLRVSRNKRTGRSKHYAFLEFDSSSVAQIVAETMDNYLLMGHILRCKVIPKDEVHPELWVGANRKWRVVPADRVARVAQNKPRTVEEQEKAAKRL
ncbi:nucleolar protein, partial [Marasmius crinis-equi]